MSNKDMPEKLPAKSQFKSPTGDLYPTGLKKKLACLLNPQTRKRYMVEEGYNLHLDFEHAESELIIFDKDTTGEIFYQLVNVKNNAWVVTCLWKIVAGYIDRSFSNLKNHISY
jgi:hypothetical protein